MASGGQWTAASHLNQLSDVRHILHNENPLSFAEAGRKETPGTRVGKWGLRGRWGREMKSSYQILPSK